MFVALYYYIKVDHKLGLAVILMKLAIIFMNFLNEDFLYCSKFDNPIPIKFGHNSGDVCYKSNTKIDCNLMKFDHISEEV